MNLLRWLLQRGGIFADIGANIGSYTLIASEPAGARVFAFEPHPETFKLLRRNLALNTRKNAFPFNIALSNRAEPTQLTNRPGSALNHLARSASSDTILVQCERADEFFSGQGVLPQYVKLDVEGLENEVLEGFGSLLSEIDLLFIEVNGLSDIRGRGGARGAHTTLIEHGFQGPFRCDFPGRTLVHCSTRSSEDSVYVHSRFRPTLESLGVRFVERLI